MTVTLHLAGEVLGKSQLQNGMVKSPGCIGKGLAIEDNLLYYLNNCLVVISRILPF